MTRTGPPWSAVSGLPFILLDDRFEITTDPAPIRANNQHTCFEIQTLSLRNLFTNAKPWAQSGARCFARTEPGQLRESRNHLLH